MQASLKLVLEPIFEADFQPCSYGFRPKRRAHDAIAEIHYLASPLATSGCSRRTSRRASTRSTTPALMDRVRRRIGDKRVLALVKAFLKAGILTEDRPAADTDTGTPQGGILSPLLANIALSVLDEHFAQTVAGQLSTQDRPCRAPTPADCPTYRLVRYADDFVVLVSGHPRATPKRCASEVAAVLAPMGLRLSAEKTTVAHIDEGFDFLGWRIQRHRKRGTDRSSYVYTYPSKKAARGGHGEGEDADAGQDTNQPLATCCAGSTRCCGAGRAYFRHGVSASDLQLPAPFTWRQVVGWLRRKHRRTNWKDLRRRYCAGGWWPADGESGLVRPRHGADHPLPLPGSNDPHAMDTQTTGHSRHDTSLWRAGCSETGTSGSGGGPGKRTGRKTGTALRADLTRLAEHAG